MSQYHQLNTQKYVDEVQKEEVREFHRHVAKRSFKSFLLLGFSVCVFLFSMYAVFQMPNLVSGELATGLSKQEF